MYVFYLDKNWRSCGDLSLRLCWLSDNTCWPDSCQNCRNTQPFLLERQRQTLHFPLSPLWLQLIIISFPSRSVLCFAYLWTLFSLPECQWAAAQWVSTQTDVTVEAAVFQSIKVGRWYRCLVLCVGSETPIDIVIFQNNVKEGNHPTLEFSFVLHTKPSFPLPH